MRRSWLLTISAAFACGPNDRPDNTPVESACGVSQGKLGSECASLSDCGGPNNARRVEFCESCFARADSHVCESGMCRQIDTTGSIKTAFSVPPSAAGALSYTVAALNPTKADGTELSCAKLLSTCSTFRDDFTFNAANSTFKAFPAPADLGNVYPVQTPADVGAGRMLMVLVTQASQGKGAVLAKGCVGGIEVKPGEITTVQLELVAP